MIGHVVVLYGFHHKWYSIRLLMCKPSILSLDTGIYPLGVTCTHRSHMAPLGPLLGLVGVRASCGLVYGPLWCVCGSFWRVIVAIFLVVHITLQEGSEVIPMFQLSWSLQGHVEVRSTRACFDHSSLIQTRNCTPFFFHGFLTLPETFYQIFKIFCNWFDRLTSGSSGSLSQLM